MAPKRKLPTNRSRPELEYEAEPHAEARPGVAQLALPRRPQSLAPGQPLVLMVLDVEEAGAGRFHVWGVTPEGGSALLRVSDFCTYFFIHAPEPAPQAADLPAILQLLNRHAPPDSRIHAVGLEEARPLLYYRPDAPQGQAFLRLTLGVGGNARKAAAAVLRAITGAQQHLLGRVWRDSTVYESEVSPLQRLLVDVPLSGGAWVTVPAAAAPPEAAGSGSPHTPRGGGQRGAGYAPVPAPHRVSTCDLEVDAPWASICCLTPDATQLADPSWKPFRGGTAAVPEPVQRAAEAARRGDLAPLRLALTDVLAATRDGVDRVPVAGEDPIVAITCSVLTFTGAHADGVPPGGEDSGESSMAEKAEDEDGGAAVATSVATVAAAPTTARSAAQAQLGGRQLTVFLLAHGQGGGEGEARELPAGPRPARVLLFGSEGELLLSWLAFMRATDPDVLAVFQTNESMALLRARFAALRLDGGGIYLSRMARQHSRSMEIKKTTMYSANWVRSQSRMSSTSNQETFSAAVEGRAVVDVLRQVLSGSNLGTYSLADAVQSLLGETLEVLRPSQLARLAGLAPHPGARSRPGALPREAHSLRLARYGLRRVTAVQSLLYRLSTIPEAVEMARATGLTLGMVVDRAQMVRTWSLLLRAARRQRYLVPNRPESSPLSEHTFILHPVEQGTVGLHKQPVAILDFASLYPSLYRAHNMCYSTLLHPDDRHHFPQDQVTVTPTGALFLKPSVRPGIMPGILAALIVARTATREQLEAATEPAQRAVLDARQRALKVTANAAYGFTGAPASPLQCVAMADSCLAYGAQACRHAVQVLHDAASRGDLGPYGGDAKTIYGHTDSLFVLLPGAPDAVAAIQAGRKAAAVVSSAFPAPMALKFERVCHPLLLLHVNRYAGRAYEREADVAAGGELIVKGLKSMWRQTAPILRTTLHGALVRVVMQGDVRGAVAFVEGEVRRLLTGQVSLHELVMTGGLWRVTGEQVERAAAAAAAGGEEGPSSPPPASPAGGGAGEEEVRGPHAALAVRLSQRDPGRSFVLGERLPYVLLAGHRLQEDAAEDPLAAALTGAAPDYELYWRNKLQRPLTELFATVLSSAQLQELLTGPHSRVRGERLAAAPPPGPSSPASPSPGKGRGGRPGKQQAGLTAFFRQVPRCLGCREAMPSSKGPEEETPGLCDACSSTEGRWAGTQLGLLREAGAAEARQCAAHAACRQCHSGLLCQDVLCENSECPVFFARLQTASRTAAADRALHRLSLMY